MPCMSYESDARPDNTQADEIKRLKKINDRLARIACKALTVLESLPTTKAGTDEVRDLMFDKDVKAWWPKHKAADERRKAQERAAQQQKMQKEAAKKRILDNVNPEDLAVLGIKL